MQVVVVLLKNKPKSKFADEYQKRILGNVMGSNRLELTASFDECGEWGGHNESFDIYRENKILYAKYLEDIVDCKNPYEGSKMSLFIKLNPKAIQIRDNYYLTH